MAKVLMKGNEAICAAAIKAGCKHFFGYPITPQNEIPEYFSRELPKVGGQFVQAESEVAAINMIYGCGGAGVRCMTSSSSPGIALKQEGISYMAGARVPAVIVNISRGGPGLGNILPSQADYNQVTRGGGNGDYWTPAYAPANIQEAADLVQKAFHVAEKYRTPVFVIADGLIGQMMEPVEIRENPYPQLDNSDWATYGTDNKREQNVINSLRLDAKGLEDLNLELRATYEEVKRNEQMYGTYRIEDAETVIVAYGTTSRIARNAIDQLRAQGIKVGMIRPITILPFPTEAFKNLPESVKQFLVVELNFGQMIDDVKLALNGKYDVQHLGKAGGLLFEVGEITQKVKSLIKGGVNNG